MSQEQEIIRKNIDNLIFQIFVYNFQILSDQAQVASYLLKQDGVKLPDEVWKFCRGKGMAEVLRQGKH